MRVGLLIALRSEVPALFPHHQTHTLATYEVGRATVGLLVSGMGQRRARAAAERLCQEFRPDYLLVLGVCGGVAASQAAADMAIGDLLVASEVVARQSRIRLGSERSAEAHAIALQAEFAVHVGVLQTCDRPVLSRYGIADDVLGVDMESYAVADVAQRRGVPVVVVRAISDIVPTRASPRALVDWMGHFRQGFAVACEKLERFAVFYFQGLT